MPSDDTHMLDSDGPGFSRRQLRELDETLDNRGFSPRQLRELDEILDNRGFSPRQLRELDEILETTLEEKLEQKLEEKLEQKLEQKIEEKLEQKLEQKFNERGLHRGWRTELLADFQHMLNAAFEDWTTRLRAATEPMIALGARVHALDAEDLPARVGRLEAAVFPPPKVRRPARRRRG